MKKANSLWYKSFHNLELSFTQSPHLHQAAKYKEKHNTKKSQHKAYHKITTLQTHTTFFSVHIPNTVIVVKESCVVQVKFAITH